MNLHWRYKSLYWSQESKQFELREKKTPVKYYCHTHGCKEATLLDRRVSGKLVPKKFCSKCLRRRWRVNNPFHHIYSELKRSATRRGIYFHLHRGEFITFCLEHGLYRESTKFTKDSLTVDRIDHKLGYTFDNIQVITQHENTVKGNRERKRYSKYRPPVEEGLPDNEPF